MGHTLKQIYLKIIKNISSFNNIYYNKSEFIPTTHRNKV